ncbi:MAG: class I SAM-dependent methyltransferase [Acidimicrobiales bacterium]
MPSSAPSFSAVRDALQPISGWLTDTQAERLFEAARRVPTAGRIVEIGSFQGRSTVALALGASEMTGPLVAIDPHAGNDRGPQEIAGYGAEAAADHDVFHANLETAGVADRVRHVRQYSSAALEEAAGPIDLLYIDGAHRFGPARADIVEWGAHVVPGGSLLIHDTFSSVGVTAALLVTLLPGDRFRYVGRSGSLSEYRAERLTPPERVRNALHQLAQLPWFARNLLIKALIVAKARPLARLVGHDGETWPY